MELFSIRIQRTFQLVSTFFVAKILFDNHLTQSTGGHLAAMKQTFEGHCRVSS